MNIFIIGMPASGKTTVAARLAKALDKAFVDLDALIEKRAHMFIDTIFDRFGEETFRRLETEARASLDTTDAVVSCGGGIVTKAENKDLMDGFTVFLETDIEVLKTRLGHGFSRPLLKETSLESLHDARFLKYRFFADAIVSNDHGPDDAVRAIITLLEERNIV